MRLVICGAGQQHLDDADLANVAGDRRACRRAQPPASDDGDGGKRQLGKDVAGNQERLPISAEQQPRISMPETRPFAARQNQHGRSAEVRLRVASFVAQAFDIPIFHVRRPAYKRYSCLILSERGMPNAAPKKSRYSRTRMLS